jgi:trehalose 6-phosphate phosphatase
MPPEPLPARAALLLDLDGTLLDIAPTPDAVVVPGGLPETLRRLRSALDDAVAIITGRPVEQAEALLPDSVFAIAGEHGGAIRFAPAAPITRAPLPAPPEEWLAAAAALVAAHPGTLLERKSHSFAVHYRLAPEAGPAVEAALRAILGATAGHVLLPAKMAFEVKPRGADKGRAVAALLGRPPFAGRVPVFVGDDVTDVDAIRAAEAAGGIGLLVENAFGSPAGVRAWLMRLAAQPVAA